MAKVNTKQTAQIIETPTDSAPVVQTENLGKRKATYTASHNSMAAALVANKQNPDALVLPNPSAKGFFGQADSNNGGGNYGRIGRLCAAMVAENGGQPVTLAALYSAAIEKGQLNKGKNYANAFAHAAAYYVADAFKPRFCCIKTA